MFNLPPDPIRNMAGKHVGDFLADVARRVVRILRLFRLFRKFRMLKERVVRVSGLILGLWAIVQEIAGAFLRDKMNEIPRLVRVKERGSTRSSMTGAAGGSLYDGFYEGLQSCGWGCVEHVQCTMDSGGRAVWCLRVWDQEYL